MKVRFAAPTLQSLDRERAGTLVVGAFTEERPLRGLAGRVDWRLCGRLSQLLGDGALEVEFGAALLCPIGDRLPFSRLLFIGLGSAAEFDAERYGQACHVIAWKLARMNERSFAMRLPGIVGRDIGLRAAVWGWRHGIIRSFDSAALAALDICVLADDEHVADLRAPMSAVADEVNEALRREIERREMANAPPMPQPMAAREQALPVTATPEGLHAVPRPRTTGVIRLGKHDG